MLVVTLLTYNTSRRILLIKHFDLVRQLTDLVSMISEQTNKNSQSTEQADKLSEKSMQNPSTGSEEMRRMLSSMTDIKDSSTNISKIIKVIDVIASHTNLLALNASVESARTVEHGKGFVRSYIKNREMVFMVLAYLYGLTTTLIPA